MAKPFPKKKKLLNYIQVAANLNVKFKKCLLYSTQHTRKNHRAFTLRMYHNFERYPCFPRNGILLV